MRTQLFVLLGLGLAVSACSGADDAGAGGADDEAAAWEEAFEEVSSGKADSTGCSGVIVPDRSGFGKKIALTFDDGPNLTTTPIVLDALKKHGAKGVFFVNGAKLTTAAQKDLLKKMADDGHFIGNHSHNHLNLKNESASSVQNQVGLTKNLLADMGIAQRYFRFPYGSSSCQSASIVRENGYAITGWHIDSADWCYASATGGVGYCAASTFKYVETQYRGDMVGFIVSQAKKQGGGVLLMHDIHANTANTLDKVLTALKQEGFSFADINDTSVFPLLNGASAAPSGWIGTPCKDDTACKFSSGGKTGECYGFSASGQVAGFCTLDCNGYCPDQAGAAPTFCTSLDGGVTGSCVSKASEANHQCADLPGTSAAQADRFIGTSTAAPAQATVCLPK